MAKALPLPTTQRAYTLRLRGIDPNDQSWRDALWATHEAVNRGAKVFGNWLLTLRGGLDHNLADEGPPEQRKDRRILLALSWLNVEDAHGAPQEESLIVASGTDSADCRARKLCDALVQLLKARAVSDTELGDPQKRLDQQPGTWLGDCMASLSAEIREDAVWVNRSAAFDAAVKQCPSLTRDEIWDFLEPFFASPKFYLKPTRTDTDEEADGDTNANDEKAKDLVQKAGGWLSKRMGSGAGADFTQMSDAYRDIANWAKENSSCTGSGNQILATLATHLDRFSPPSKDSHGVLAVISGPGYKSATRNHLTNLKDLESVTHQHLTKLAELAAEDANKCMSKVGNKGPRQYASMVIEQVKLACGFTYLQADGAARHCEFSVMLDHAARRVNVAHSWIKNAEAERRQFEGDAKRLGSVPPEALAWLQKYCEERAGSSGSLDEYRIRRRAIEGWDKVVNRWSRADCQTAEDRISTVRQLQDDPEIDKFGDGQLFEALATNEAACVWNSNGTTNVQALKDFVVATDAEAKKKRFKVPAYRHPDPLRHPVFTDFGNSRWHIDYSAHRESARLGDVVGRVEKLAVDLDRANQQLVSANESQRTKCQAKADEVRFRLQQARDELSGLQDQYRLELRLWNGQTVEPTPLHWSCKRLFSDLALRSANGISQENLTSVSRADRLGRAVANVNAACGVTVAGLFDQNHWNGRLQAPRSQLDTIARYVDKHGWDAKTRRMLDKIRWLIGFSVELTQSGSWTEYCNQFPNNAPAKPFVSRKGEYHVKHRDNDRRTGHSKLILSRLPGLRILSVDLGHRYAAACAVWEAIASDQMKEACVAVGVAPPSIEAMYVHLKSNNSRGKTTTTIYRRIGTDTLPDGNPHPAPWARLDRQFLIKLQGEDRPARKASLNEITAVEDFEVWAGVVAGDNDLCRRLAVDSLMNNTVRTARLALSRHGRRARIAHNLVTDTRTLPGERQSVFDEAGRIEHLTNTLADWHSLATDRRWSDEHARQLWNDCLTTLDHGFSIQPPRTSQAEVEQSSANRRQVEEALRQRLAPLADALARIPNLRQNLHDAWVTRWQSDDERWRTILKWLSRWLMPRGGSRRDASRRHVGGLSLTRISTLTEFRRKVQVAFYTRLRPNGARAEIGRRFGQATLDTIQRLKEQRVKQLASRVVEAALGIGIERHSKTTRDLARPRERINDLRFAPCHAVVIEDLSHYRPDEIRTRRENRATMDWKSAEARKRLADHCQLYGLHLRDVNPQYTSRQDSRTGAPGMRCIDVPVAEFLTKAWWRKQVAQAQKKAKENKGDVRERYLLALEARWANADDAERTNAKPLRIPVNGGELFVSADGNPASSAGLQADLNAAANIGLRALMDPDFPGKWWYVPCDPKTKKPHADKVKGSIIDGVGPLQQVESMTAATPTRGRARGTNSSQKEIVNLWRDPATATISGVGGDEKWCETPVYWNITKARVIRLLCEGCGLPTT